jgi:hypothetical protein
LRDRLLLFGKRVHYDRRARHRVHERRTMRERQLREQHVLHDRDVLDGPRLQREHDWHVLEGEWFDVRDEQRLRQRQLR